MAREALFLYHSYLDAIEPLSDAECGRLFKSLLEYSMTGATKELGGNERFIFPMMRAQVDRDKEAYEEKCQKNRNNRMAALTNVEESDDRQQPLTDATKNKNKNKDKDKNKEKDIYHSSSEECVRESENVPEEKSNKCRVDYNKLLETFNAICISLPNIKMMTDKRKEKVRIFIKYFEGDTGKQRLIELFRKAEASDFLTGRKGNGRKFGFDWLIEYNNAVKVLEGNYDNAATNGGAYKNASDKRNTQLCGEKQDDPYKNIEPIPM